MLWVVLALIVGLMIGVALGILGLIVAIEADMADYFGWPITHERGHQQRRYWF
jgi:hypothetical protein